MERERRTMTYKIVEVVNITGETNQILKRTNEDGSVSWIPMDESNADYQRYLNPDAELGGTL